jgi:polyvinyl alcohol dehydrogenase (cytochrome)
MLRVGRGLVAVVIAAVAGLLAAGATGAVAQAGPGGAPGQSGETPGQWPMAGQNIGDTHFQVGEHQISPASVGRLALRWTLTAAGAISATPIVDDGAVYVPDYGGKLWAVAAGSGRVLWSRDISSYTGVTGDVSRTSPAVYGDELILGDGWILSPGTSGAHVFAVDRRTSKLV